MQVDTHTDSLRSSQRVEVLSVQSGTCVSGADGAGLPLAQEPAVTAATQAALDGPFTADTPVDNHTESFPTLEGAPLQAYGEEEEGEEATAARQAQALRYDPYQSEEAAAPNGVAVPPVVLSGLSAPTRLRPPERHNTNPSNGSRSGSLRRGGSRSSNARESAARGSGSDAAPRQSSTGTPRSRRRSTSVTTLDRPLTSLHGSSGGGVIAVAAETPAGPDAVRGFVYTLIAQHGSNVAAWEGKVGVAEVYRDKPTRTGGRPASLRPADKAFLERVDKGLADHVAQLHDARAILAQQEVLYEDVTPVLQARSTSERRASEADDAWLAQCEAMSAQLAGYLSQTAALQRRVWLLLDGDGSDVDVYLPRRARSAQRRSSRSRSRGPDSPSRYRSHSRRGSVQRADGQLTFANGMASSAIVPGPSDVGSSIESSIQRGNQLQAVSPGSPTPHAQPSRSRSPVRAPPLHPDTIRRGGSVEMGSAYDRGSPYGRLSPVRRHSLTQADPQVQRQLRMADNGTAPQRMIAGGATETNSDSDAATNPRPLQSYLGSTNGTQTELVTYASPRGPAEPFEMVPALTSTQRKQLLLTIAYYEKNAVSLRKADLKTARDCFMDLYGPQRGLRQYCNWIDDLALQALRQNR